MERATITIHPTHIVRIAFAIVTLIIVSACAGNTRNAPEVNVISPAPNAEVITNVSFPIQANVSGDNITRVDVLIDGQTYAILTTDDKTKGMPTFPVNVPWAAPNDGVHVVQFIVYGADSLVIIKSDPVIFKAVPKGGVATPKGGAATPLAATVAPTQVAAGLAAIATAAPISNAVPLTNPAQVAAVVTATAGVLSSNDPSLTITSDTANVRSGPSTGYDIVGQLQNGATAPVRGKSADGAWWQIAFPSAPGGVGWVRGDLVQPNPAAASVPAAVAPPTSTASPYTPTPAPSTPAPTTAERACDASSPEWKGADAKYPFCVAKVLTWYDNQDGAHRYESTRDVAVSLSWDIWGVDSIWIVFDQDNTGYCDFTKQAAKTINQQVPLAGTFAFHTTDFPGGATMRIHLNVKRKDGQVVEYGDKRLCIF